MTTYTPMIQQYLAIKAEVKDAFLFFRLGDFYELFFEDAVLAAKELEITLTGREGGTEERIPMCGVPYHSADNYISRLIEKGYKVAICEQVEDPKEAKGVVRREIVRIVTPGTVMEGKTLGEAANNFIVAAAEVKEQYGIAACDLTTGELYVTSFAASKDSLLDEAKVYNPSEIIGDSSLLEQIGQDLSGGSRPPMLTEWSMDANELIRGHFPAETLAALNEPQLKCVGYLIAYLNVTQKRSLSHITRIQTYEPQHFMILDPFTRRNLELTETIRDRSKQGSLLWLLDRTVTSIGSRMLRRWVDKPLMNKARIEERLEAVDTLYNRLITREELRMQLKEVYDLERLVGRISFGTSNARDLLALGLSLRAVPGIVETCAASGSITLQRLVEGLDDCRDVMKWIDQAIVDDPPISVKEGGMIRPGFNLRLDRLREASVNGKQWIADLEKKEREITGIRTLKIGYNKVFGYYIEVTKANIGHLPDGRYERKQTLANAERYITPELKEKEALILEAEEKMVDIEYELFIELRDRIGAQVARLQKLAGIIATVDALQSMASVSAEYRYRRPEVTEGYDLVIEEGRHPVVEALMKDGKFVHNQTSLTQDEARMLLITGPNMAGKSTYMRQVALISVMAQIGCFVPAERALIPLVDRIFTRIGAADDLAGGQSTFMVEMTDIQVMTEKATARSLVIIDELGRGTSTGEGMAIAQAVIEYLHERIGCKTLVSTHFHELAHLEESLGHLRNYCMAVQESGDQVAFLRKLIRGAAGTSYGIYCAKLAGLPATVIDRAYQLLNAFELRDSAALQRAETAAAVVQLSLFGGEEESRLKSKRKADAADEVSAEIMRSLRSADPMNMTPLQAMQLLMDLKQLAQK
ncbi:DNA mismatch repair protein MutS [Ferviditalea candida]|uniref:DNA mismatch repair protein MutS n=1 Tax=Ferviditalea candida TaxID=3108399 RepID=A0ABU5ZJP0_9BACL|nr:DNA mismatch repair protein MutS [Paenibacillaceae bacterium T2]